MQRRRFLIAAGWGSAGLLLPTPSHASLAPPPKEAGSPWPILEAALTRLLPADGDGPGAEDLGAVGYLRRALDGPRLNPDDRDLVLNGAGWLDDAARQEAGAAFTALPPAEQDAVLATIEQSPAGERWLARLLDFLLEAVLADPVYGGNPSGLGWRWLHHRPGFPRPTADNTCDQLAARWRA